MKIIRLNTICTLLIYLSVPFFAGAQTWQEDGIPSVEETGGQVRTALNSKDLNSAYLAANPGDHIVLTGTKYDGIFNFNKNGTAEKPIVIRVENGNLLNVEITSTNGSCMGDHNIIWGIHFNPPNAWKFFHQGNNCKFLRCKFSKMQIVVKKKDVGFGYNEFCKTEDIAIRVTPYHSGAKNCHIYRNYFHAATSSGNGHESIMIGNGSQDAWVDASCIVEYNLFENLNHLEENEIVGIKSARNIVRYNTFKNIHQSGNLSNRCAKECSFIGNWFDGNAGIYVRGKDNRIIANKITGTGKITLWAGNYDPNITPLILCMPSIFLQHGIVLLLEMRQMFMSDTIQGISGI